MANKAKEQEGKELEAKDVDISVLEELIDLRKQQEMVDQYCQRAEERKEKVETAVYKRVIADYAKRRSALEQQAEPLVTRAIAEYRKLRAVYERVQATHTAAKLDKEEVEFRHALGEIDDAAKADRLKEPERVLSESAEKLSGLDEHEKLFKAALPNMDLAALAKSEEPKPPPRPPEPPPVPEPPPAAVLDIDADEAGDATQIEPLPPAVAEAAPPPTLSGRKGASGTRKAVEPPPIPSMPPPAPVAPGEMPVSDSGEFEDRTFIVPEAMLLSEDDGGAAVNFRLTALTYIGRSEDNQLRLTDPGVSRRHVLIMATPGGYTIRDLGSQNGTYVNGDRVDEGPLADGDRITIGEVNLVFRSAAQGAALHA